ncbi:hypothetical protein BD410DRAFT_833105 [Rickenella mellea]|uniref:Uncharacterized protein n=1 Tax=Rickenella mellea TaxID=50990 RepID=A0A4Y7PIS7_9AGAM|nr:hypothetical protein BD410DRAFT_833105 [Rickenella mellea]
MYGGDTIEFAVATAAALELELPLGECLGVVDSPVSPTLGESGLDREVEDSSVAANVAAVDVREHVDPGVVGIGVGVSDCACARAASREGCIGSLKFDQKSESVGKCAGLSVLMQGDIIPLGGIAFRREAAPKGVPLQPEISSISRRVEESSSSHRKEASFDNPILPSGLSNVMPRTVMDRPLGDSPPYPVCESNKAS